MSNRSKEPAHNLMDATAATAREATDLCGGRAGIRSHPQGKAGKAHMEKVPFSLAESELSADISLHRYLRGPVSKICAPQGPSLQGEMLQGTLMGQGHGAPLVLRLAKPGPSHCHS